MRSRLVGVWISYVFGIDSYIIGLIDLFWWLGEIFIIFFFLYLFGGYEILLVG